MATLVSGGGGYERDDEKAAANLLSKHGVSFHEAATVFADPRALYLDDGNGGPLGGYRAVSEWATADRCAPRQRSRGAPASSAPAKPAGPNKSSMPKGEVKP